MYYYYFNGPSAVCTAERRQFSFFSPPLVHTRTLRKTMDSFTVRQRWRWRRRRGLYDNDDDAAAAATRPPATHRWPSQPPGFLFRSVRRRSRSVAVVVCRRRRSARTPPPPLPQHGQRRRSRQTQFRHGGSRTYRDHTHTPRRFFFLPHTYTPHTHTEHITTTTTTTTAAAATITNPSHYARPTRTHIHTVPNPVLVFRCVPRRDPRLKKKICFWFVFSLPVRVRVCAFVEITIVQNDPVRPTRRKVRVDIHTKITPTACFRLITNKISSRPERAGAGKERSPVPPQSPTPGWCPPCWHG